MLKWIIQNKLFFCNDAFSVSNHNLEKKENTTK